MLRTLLLISFFTSILFAQVPQYNKSYLQKQNAELKKDIQELNKKLQMSRKESQTSLVFVQQLNEKITAQDKLVSNLNKEKTFVEDEIYAFGKKINILNKDLARLKKNYKSVLVNAYKNKSTQSRLLFVLTSNSLGQAMRRVKYLDKYSDYQDRKVEEISGKQDEVRKERAKRKKAKQEKDQLLAKQLVYQEDLEVERQNRQKVVEVFKKNQGKIARELRAKRSKQKAVDAQISNLIKEEIRLAKKNEEELRKKREAEEAERKRKLELAKKKALEEERKRQEELAKKRAEEEAKRLALIKAENERKEKERQAEIARIADEKERQKQKEQAEQAAEQERLRLIAEAKERKAAEDAKRKAAEVAAVKKVEAKPEFVKREAPKDLSKGFVTNRGRLPWPVENGTVVASFGVNPHPVLAGIEVENSGVDIATRRGGTAKSVFQGKIAAISVISGGNKSVIVNHGTYFTVYHNLKTVLVSKGDAVSRGQSLGAIDTDSKGQTILNFQVWKGTKKENPAAWIGGM